MQNFLEIELITDDSLDHVEDDSLQYNFPQLSLKVIEFPVGSSELAGQKFNLDESGEETFTEVNLFDDDDAFLFDNLLEFKQNEEDLELFWSGNITDFYTGSDDPIPFKLKCNFREDNIEVED